MLGGASWLEVASFAGASERSLGWFASNDWLVRCTGRIPAQKRTADDEPTFTARLG